jgi:hypothetical protein
MTTQFNLVWRNKFLTAEATSIEDMITALAEATEELRQMKAAGVVLSDDCSVADDYAMFVTTDPKVAEQFGFDPEKVDQDGDGDGEVWDDDVDDECDDDEDDEGEDWKRA